MSEGWRLSTTLRAHFIGSLAAEALSVEDSGIIGEVTNTFSNSFYFKTMKGELVFVTNQSLKSPVTINLDPESRLGQVVKPLEVLSIRQKKIHSSGGACIDVSRANPVRIQSCTTNHPSPQCAQFGQSLHLISFMLRIIDTRHSVLDPNSIAHKPAAEFMRDGILSLKSSTEAQQFRKAALKIAGLGYGFTPSGDDFLGGFLAVHNSLANTVGRPPIILDFDTLQARTSWISARLLDYMQRLVLDEQLHQMVRSATQGDGDTLTLALETLLPRGHTSGIDISTGAVLALGLIRDIALQKSDTETIINKLGLF